MKALITSLLFSCFLFISINLVASFASDVNLKSSGDATIEPYLAVEETEVAMFTMEVIEMKKGKPSKNGTMRMTYYLNGEHIAIRPELEDEQETVMIYNIDNRIITTLIDQKGKKTGMKMKMPKMNIKSDDSEDVDDFDFSFTPTNETKTIQGYACKKYLIESSDHAGYAWITEEVDIDFAKMFSFLNKKKDNSKMMKFGDLKGFAMESYSKSKKKDEEYEMKIVDLKVGEVDESIFDTSDYEITDMTNLLNMGGER